LFIHICIEFIVTRTHHNCRDAAQLLFKFRLYDTCQAKIIWNGAGRGGRREQPEAKQNCCQLHSETEGISEGCQLDDGSHIQTSTLAHT